METKFETSFIVFPEHTNALSPLIFGGAFFSQLDLCAARCVNRLLYSSADCNAAVTHKFTGTFHKPCYLGDLIFLQAKVISVREKAIVVVVDAFREKKGEEREKVAEAEFVFISVKNTVEKEIIDKPNKLPYANHGIFLIQG